MKRKLYTGLISVAAALALLLASSFALAEATAAAENASVVAGDTVYVTYTVTGAGLSVASGSFTYDPALLAFDAENSSYGVTDGLFTLYSAAKGGAQSLSLRAAFTASAAGEAKIDFKTESLVDYNGKTVTQGDVSVTVSIAAAPPSPTEPGVDYADPALTVKALNVSGASGDMYIWRNLDEVTVPSRYAATELAYHGENVAALEVKDSNAPVLLYLTDAMGENGGYYIYNAEKDSLYPYRTVASVSKSYILLEPDASVEVPEGFAETTITLGDNEVKAWSMKDAQGDVYLLYARSPAGDIGFYYYDPADESMQRCAVVRARPVEPTPSATAQPTASQAPATQTPDAPPAEPTHTISPALFYAVSGAAALFLILFVVSLVSHAAEEKKRRERAAARRKKDREAMDAMDPKDTGV